MGMYDRDWYKDSQREPHWFGDMHPIGKVLLVAFGIALLVGLYFRVTSSYAGRQPFQEAEMIEALRIQARARAANQGIHEAVDAGNIGRVAELLAADPALVHAVQRKEAPDQPLHLAAAAGHRSVAELLLRYGADVNARGDQGMTPLHAAALNGNCDVADLLLKRGANASLKNDAGETPLDVARGSEEPECVRIAELLRRPAGKR